MLLSIKKVVVSTHVTYFTPSRLHVEQKSRLQQIVWQLKGFFPKDLHFISGQRVLKTKIAENRKIHLK